MGGRDGFCLHMNGEKTLCVYGKQTVALCVCVFGQSGAVVCVEDYVSVDMFICLCGCVKL